jgi:hypothetical protein
MHGASCVDSSQWPAPASRPAVVRAWNRNLNQCRFRQVGLVTGSAEQGRAPLITHRVQLPQTVVGRPECNKVTRRVIGEPSPASAAYLGFECERYWDAERFSA